MRTLYIDCSMGAAGDMLSAALLELLEDKDKFIEELNSLGIPDVKISSKPASKCGINGRAVTVTVGGVEEDEHMHDHSHEHEHDHEHSHEHEHDHDHHNHDHPDETEHHEHDHHHDNENAHDHSHDHSHTHHHSSMHDIEHIVSSLAISDRVKSHVMAVYKLIAQAESHAHGVSVSQIHFHEVGAMDAVADIVTVCMLLDRLSPQRIIASPINVGSGQVKCAHGILPVPAPATAHILREVPIYSGQIKSELCTPTGAALLKHFVSQFGEMPIMKTQAIGYGMGKKDFEVANCVRVLLGETEESSEIVHELSCNLDDMTAEAIGFATERLFEAGALEVYTIPVGMKKSRPGTLLCVMCKEGDRDGMIRLLLKHTTTLGVRESVSRRYALDRRIQAEQTPFGQVRIKRAEGYGVKKEKYEYDDIAGIARERNMSMDEVIAIIKADKK